MNRIIAGLRRFGGPQLEPFLVILRGTSSARSIERPVPAVTAQGQHLGLCEPFLLQQQSGGAPRPVSRPAPTVAAKGAIGLVEPFLVPFKSEREGQKARTHSVAEPMPTVASGGNFGLVEPFILPPLGYHHRGGKANKPRSLESPLQTVTSRGGGHLVQPFVMHVTHGGRERSIDAPLPTVTCAPRGEMALVEPFLAKYNGTGGAVPITDPVPTLTAKDRLGLVTAETDGTVLDVHFRMLQPHELARAMAFDDGYVFHGNREQRVRQIGNAVCVNLARALCRALLE